jgi:CBS domain-containing protein
MLPSGLPAGLAAHERRCIDCGEGIASRPKGGGDRQDGQRHQDGEKWRGLVLARRPVMRVKDAMHQGVYWVEPDTALTEIAQLMATHNIGAIPIGENDRLVGMVTERDIVCRGLAKGLELSNATARDVMTKGIFYTTETAEVAEAAAIMEKHKVRRLPVIDNRKRMTGMLSIGDVSHAGDRRLCGEILDAVAARAA